MLEMIRISRLDHYNFVGKICCRRSFRTRHYRRVAADWL